MDKLSDFNISIRLQKFSKLTDDLFLRQAHESISGQGEVVIDVIGIT